ncbi:TRAP transporter small permease [Rhodoplanes sp. TEM]|uniref:TRAP transporter small permease protein n=1 Tax=Rhodoplanes tepidamans TaxID=200616 RepID=A0ABT5JCW4_RHOTP|nr:MULTISPECIES: TRAP transporter small permease [Rhodoplanes]MDC7787451.1 TRAP transporter small permease [Rhodoplanes tepidamans]MDC7986360.1 TRAP transporter small permease [Rhodoplanes sp. TEM]MDQ0358063.1 TRAP-type C4-dicarboxylate transport system permease small subunit [Rhodoplanes tepidamans]
MVDESVMLTGRETPTTLPPAAWLARAVARAGRGLLGLVLLGMVVLNVCNALGRYVFGAVFIGADEVLVFAMVWMVMIGTLFVTADRSHIALDFLPLRASVRMRLVFAIVHHAAIALGAGYAAVQSFAFVGRVAAMGQTSMALGLPMTIPHAALLVGFGGSALIAVALVVADAVELARRQGFGA